MHRLALYSLVLLVAGTAQIPAGNLTKIWEVRLAELPGSEGMNAAALVYSVSFAPDGRTLSVVVKDAEARSKFAILSVDDPRRGMTGVKNNGPIADALTSHISWSSTGNEVAIPTVFHILAQPWTGCALEHTLHAVFYDSDRVADVQRGFPDSTILFFDSSCNPIGSWAIKGLWERIDGSPDRHLLVLSNNIPKDTEVIVLDPLRRKLVRRWQMEETNGTWPVFADSGRAVCAIDGTGRHGVAHCWDVEGDHEISETTSGNPHGNIAAALHARRVVLSSYGWRFEFEGFYTEVGSLEKRVVWDFGTGKEITSWKSKYQHPAHSQIWEPYPVAISPDGTMVAEGGLGMLTLYRIQP